MPHCHFPQPVSGEVFGILKDVGDRLVADRPSVVAGYGKLGFGLVDGVYIVVEVDKAQLRCYHY